MDTGIHARVKPFGIEVRNVKCVRCGNYGHQSGDRECPLKDVIMPNEESRLRRDDPLSAIMAHADPSEPLKWELKQKPGLSPPRGGFRPDDPNQQIVAEDIFDEYGGFLSGDPIPELLSNFPLSKPRKKSKKGSKHRKRSSQHYGNELSSLSESEEKRSQRKEKRHKRKKRKHPKQTSLDESESDTHRNSRRNSFHPTEDFGSARLVRDQNGWKKHLSSSGRVFERHRRNEKGVHKQSYSSGDSDFRRNRGTRKERKIHKHSYYSGDSDSSRHCGTKKERRRHSYSSGDFDSSKHHGNKKERRERSYSSEDDSDRQKINEKSSHKHSYSFKDSDSHIRRGSKQSQHKSPYSSEEDSDRHSRRGWSRQRYLCAHSFADTESNRNGRNIHRQR